MHSVYIFSQSKSVLFTFVGHSSVEAAGKEGACRGVEQKRTSAFVYVCNVDGVFQKSNKHTHFNYS